MKVFSHTNSPLGIPFNNPTVVECSGDCCPGQHVDCMCMAEPQANNPQKLLLPVINRGQ